MNGFVRLKADAEISGRRHQAAAVIEVDADTARDLIARGIAVPAPGPGARAIHSGVVVAEVGCRK